MLLAKTFTVPVEPVVKPTSEVTTSQKPFFDPGATTSSLARETTDPCLDQATGEAVDEMQTATQPLEAPGAGTATQPVQAPGSVPDVQPTCEGDLCAASDSEADQLSLTGSLDDEIHQDQSPDRDVPRDEAADQEPTEEANYRETMRGVRSFMNWHKIPEFETVSSAADDNPFAGARVQPTSKVSNFRSMTGCAERCLNSTLPSQKGIPPGTLTTLTSSEISSSSPPGRLDGMGCMLRKNVRVQQYALGHRNLPNSTIPSAGLHVEVFLLLHPPGPSARTCLGVGREQHVNRQ